MTKTEWNQERCDKCYDIAAYKIVMYSGKVIYACEEHFNLVAPLGERILDFEG
jgi:hypothetical protein